MTLINVRQVARIGAVFLVFSLVSAHAFAQPGAPQVTLLPDNSVIISYAAPTTPPPNTLLVATFNGSPVGPFAIGQATSVYSGFSLPPGSYTVQIVWGQGPGQQSPVTAFNAPAIVPGPPAAPILAAPFISGNTVTLTWTAIPNATSYELEVLIVDASQTVILQAGNTNSITVPNVPMGDYVVRVRGRNVFGAGAFSNQVLVDLTPSFRLRDLEISLTWNTTSDIDLHVIEPDGTHVWWRVPRGKTARLDRDNTTGFGPEVISVLPGAGVRGVYQIYIVHYRGEAPTISTIAVSLGVGTPGVKTEIFTRQTDEPDAETGINVALVDITTGAIGQAFGTREVAVADSSGKPQQ